MASSEDADRSKSPPSAVEDGEEEDDDDVDDLVSAINYNTINSLTALKEILGHDSRTSNEDTSWFQHYFLRHVNRLPSRSQYPGRRLSECPEEDETVTEAANDNNSTTSSSSSSGKEQQDTTGTQEDVTKTESSSPSTSAPPTPKRNPSLTPDTPPQSPRTLSRGTSPHLDKRFFDVSLIEMKSQASSTSTLDYDSTDEVWIKRIDSDTARRRKVSRLTLFHYVTFLCVFFCSTIVSRAYVTCETRFCSC